MGVRDSLRKAAGLLIELPPEESKPRKDSNEGELDKLLGKMKQTAQQRGRKAGQTKTVEQIVREAEGPNLDEIKVPASTPAPVVTAGGKVDFSALYQQAGLPKVPFSAEQMLEMLASLPPELPMETKRQTVKVALNAMGKALGTTSETLVADASRKVHALASYAEAVSKSTTEFVTAAELEIATLQAQMEEKRKAIESAKQKQAQVSQMCDAESDRLDEVLEFFSLDVPPSKYATEGKTESK